MPESFTPYRNTLDNSLVWINSQLIDNLPDYLIEETESLH